MGVNRHLLRCQRVGALVRGKIVEVSVRVELVSSVVSLCFQCIFPKSYVCVEPFCCCFNMFLCLFCRKNVQY